MKSPEHKNHHEAKEKHIHETRAKVHEVLFRYGDTVSVVNEEDLREGVGENHETGLKIADNKIGDEAVAWTGIDNVAHVTIRQAA